MINKIKTVGLYSVSHMLIDMACVISVLSGIRYNEFNEVFTFLLIVLYNVLAFGLQSFFGDIFDKNKKPHICAFMGCILTALGAILWKFSLVAVILSGLGNAMFHVGGGIICLKLSDNKASIPGIYEAPGAIGLFLGALAVKKLISPEYCAIILLLCAVLILVNKYKEIPQTIYREIQYNKFFIILNLLLLAIAIRSFIGLSVVLPWKENLNLLFMLTLAVVLGKMTGGIIADKFGWLKVTVTALIISSPLIAFGINNPILYIIGIYFFNYTMPVTLSAIANMQKNREGFAFGLTTLALIIGAMPNFSGVYLTSNNSLSIFVFVALSAIFIYFGLKLICRKVS